MIPRHSLRANRYLINTRLPLSAYRRPLRSNCLNNFLVAAFFICACCGGLHNTSAQVSNTIPLTVICPTNIVVGFLSETGTVANFDTTVTGGCSNAAVIFTPPSETLFPIGVTPVSLLATDACSSVQCFFNVTVLGPRDIKSAMVADLLALQFAADTRTDRRGLNLVIRRLTASLDADFWIDQTRVSTNHGRTVFSQERGAVTILASLQSNRRSLLSQATLQKFIDQLAASGRLLAAIRIQDAAITSPNSKKLTQARNELAKGDNDAENRRPSRAIGHYQTAWSRVSRL